MPQKRKSEASNAPARRNGLHEPTNGRLAEVAMAARQLNLADAALRRATSVRDQFYLRVMREEAKARLRYLTDLTRRAP